MRDFDIRNLVKNLLPSFLRKPKMVAWLVVLLTYVEKLKSFFLALVRTQNYDLAFSSQTMSLEARLNQDFDWTLQRIFITTDTPVRSDLFCNSIFENQAPPYIGYLSETLSLPQNYIYYISEQQSNAFPAFTVHIPASLATSEASIKAVINMYKTASKFYQIIYF